MRNKVPAAPQDTTEEKVALAIEYAFESLSGAGLNKRSQGGSRFTAVFCEVEAVTNELYGTPIVNGASISFRCKRGTGPWNPYEYYDVKKAEALIIRARQGDAIAMDATWQIAANFVDEGCVLPEGLRQYIVDLLLGIETATPAIRRGRAHYANFERDFKIACVIRHIVDRGFRPTRNNATENESACSIVKQALQRLGLHLTEGAVVKIWEKFGPEPLNR
jgi:hypothetical protein